MIKRPTGSPAALLTLLLCLASACAGPADGPDRAAHEASVEQWRAQRLANLTSETGFLTLTGLHQLADGHVTLGGGPDSDIVLQGSVPAEVGTLEVDGGSLRFHPAADSQVTLEGEPVTAPISLTSDDPGPPTLLEIGPVNFHVILRGGVALLRVRNSNHPARSEFTGIDSFPIDASWRFDARFDLYEPTKQIPIANIIGQVSDSPSWGAVVFEREGETHRIDAIADPGDERLFLIFGDVTSGHETYGGGRYLYADAPGADGRVDLDFNRAYNPPCAFNAYATCPLPPPQNRLPIRVEAGEKNFDAGH